VQAKYKYRHKLNDPRFRRVRNVGKRKTGDFHINKELEKRWYMQKPEGTPEELAASFEKVSEYTYKIISFLDKEDVSPEDVEEARRVFMFSRQGPRAAYHAFGERNKLTSAEVIYALITENPSERVGKILGVSGRLIRQIRAGELPWWRWEYDFVRVLSGKLRKKIHRMSNAHQKHVCYELSRLTEHGTLTRVAICTSNKKARDIRQSIIKEKDYKRLEDNKELDIYYPIEEIPMM